MQSITLADLHELRGLLNMGQPAEGAPGTMMKAGQKVFIRTVTHYFVGKVAEVGAHEVRLVDASWIADTGRFSEALSSGDLSEVERYPSGVVVRLGGMIDWSEWAHDLPEETK